MISWYLGPRRISRSLGSDGTGGGTVPLTCPPSMLVRRDDEPEGILELAGLDTPIKKGFTPGDVLGPPTFTDSVVWRNSRTPSLLAFVYVKGLLDCFSCDGLSGMVPTLGAGPDETVA